MLILGWRRCVRRVMVATTIPGENGNAGSHWKMCVIGYGFRLIRVRCDCGKEMYMIVLWVVVALLWVAAIVLGLLSVHSCFGRTVALVLVGMVVTALVLVGSAVLFHL